jgi:hypothetical protein
MKNLKVKTLAKILKKMMNQVESDENHSQNTILFWSLTQWISSNQGCRTGCMEDFL